METLLFSHKYKLVHIKVIPSECGVGYVTLKFMNNKK